MERIKNVISTIYYYSHQYWIDICDPRTKGLWLNGGPIDLLAILIPWFLFVKYFGPRFMKNRKPYVLRGPMLVYNAFMVITNAYFWWFILTAEDAYPRLLDFKFPDPNDRSPRALREIQFGHWVYLTRFMDLLDTIFFVLRKKFNQITFLHLYHHTIVPILAFFCMKIAPLAPVIGVFLIFNTFIHSIMYLYYFLSAFGPTVQKYLWWKKYITQLQLVQFATCFCYGVVMVFLQEGFPPGLFWLGFFQNPFFFYMFYDFYRKSYHKNHQKDKINYQNDKKKSNEAKSHYKIN